MLEKEEIKAVIFDSDGTLVDTRELIIEGYKENLRLHGFEDIATTAHILSCIGGRVSNTVSRLIDRPESDTLVMQMVSELDAIQDRIADSTMWPTKV